MKIALRAAALLCLACPTAGWAAQVSKCSPPGAPQPIHPRTAVRRPAGSHPADRRLYPGDHVDPAVLS